MKDEPHQRSNDVDCMIESIVNLRVEMGGSTLILRVDAIVEADVQASKIRRWPKRSTVTETRHVRPSDSFDWPMRPTLNRLHCAAFTATTRNTVHKRSLLRFLQLF